MTVDVHAHFTDRAYIEALVDLHGLHATPGDADQVLLRKGTTSYTWFRDSFFDVDEGLRRMDRLGIATRILSLSTPSVYDWPVPAQVVVARAVNEALARHCAAHPDRFKGLATLPLADVSASIAELRRCVDELGFVGMAIGSNVGGLPLNAPGFDALWAEVDKCRLPVVEHPMFPLGSAHLDEFELPLRVGFVYDTTTAATRMIYGGVFERFPNFPFVLAHTGGALLTILERLDNGYRLFPDCRKYISKLPSEYAKGLYYDTCCFSQPTLMLALELVGVERLMWGSDDPFISADTAHVDRLPISAEDKAMILTTNARRIFRF